MQVEAGDNRDVGPDNRAQAPDQFAFLTTSWEGASPHLDLLAGTARLREGLVAGEAAAALVESWRGDVAAWRCFT